MCSNFLQRDHMRGTKLTINTHFVCVHSKENYEAKCNMNTPVPEKIISVGMR